VPGLLVLVLCAIAGTAWPANNQQLLEQVANHAIDSLGRPDGYFGNPDARIALPGKLEKLRKVLQPLGASKEVDALVLAINGAAETALPECRALVIASIRDMPRMEAGQVAQQVEDFRAAMSDRLATEMLPQVSKATKGVHLARTYNDVAAKASALGVMDQRDADLDAYVTRKTLEGLFTTMTMEETTLRARK
jgi:hypothetical protein